VRASVDAPDLVSRRAVSKGHVNFVMGYIPCVSCQTSPLACLPVASAMKTLDSFRQPAATDLMNKHVTEALLATTQSPRKL
jgi:hypothetical protein